MSLAAEISAWYNEAYVATSNGSFYSKMDFSGLSIYLTATDDPSPLLHSDSLGLSLRSLSPAVPHKTKRKQRLAKSTRTHFPLTDRQEVEQLSDWKLAKLPDASPVNYHVRYTELYQLIAQRKPRNYLPALSRSTPQLHCSMGLTSDREMRAAKNESLAEKSRSSRLYEEELETTAKALESELRDLQQTCVNSRMANTMLRSKLLKGSLLTDPPPVLQLHKEFLKASIASRLKMQVQRKSVFRLTNDSGFLNKQEFETAKPHIEEEIAHNTLRTKEAESRIKEVKERLQTVRREQKRHFKEVLAAGEDSRGEGLAWVVKALWRLGETVQPEAFPSWVDARTVEVVGLLAEKGVELERLMAVVESQRKISYRAQAHPDRWNNVKARLQTLAQHPLPACTSTTPQTPLLSLSESLFQRISELKAEMTALQTEEMKRVVQECCLNRMEQHLGAGLLQILAAVIGVEMLKKEKSVVAKMKQALLESRSKVKTFAFGRQQVL